MADSTPSHRSVQPPRTQAKAVIKRTLGNLGSLNDEDRAEAVTDALFAAALIAQPRQLDEDAAGHLVLTVKRTKVADDLYDELTAMNAIAVLLDALSSQQASRVSLWTLDRWYVSDG